MADPATVERDAGQGKGPVGLDVLGIKNINNVYWNLTTPALYEQIIRRREGVLAHLPTCPPDQYRVRASSRPIHTNRFGVSHRPRSRLEPDRQPLFLPGSVVVGPPGSGSR